MLDDRQMIKLLREGSATEVHDALNPDVLTDFYKVVASGVGLVDALWHIRFRYMSEQSTLLENYVGKRLLEVDPGHAPRT